MYGLHLVDQEISYFQGRNVLCKYIIEMLNYKPYNFTSKTLCTLILYRSTSNKTNTTDTTFRTVINWTTSTFFTPSFARTLDGRSWIEIAPMNNRCRAVAAKLLLLHCKYLIIRLHQSIAPCTTILQYFNWWWQIICLKVNIFSPLLQKDY